MFKKILLGLLIVVVVLVAVIATRPGTFRMERSTSVAAPPDVVYAQVADFHRWSAWSPWDKLDPGMKRKFEGPPSGVGASYSWEGNDKVGEGRMTITDAKPNEQVVIKLEFIKPWPATNTATFTMSPSGANTNVSWAMSGDLNFMAKAFSLFKDMEQMIGPDFEKGLAGIKEQAEAEAKKRAEAQAAAPPAPAAAPAPGAAPPAAPAVGHP
jgi:uncharacterized protein YndB with AHSA1/START domain